jgi:chemotaxis protein methyltransferase CheR
MMDSGDLEQIELDLLFEAIYKRYGYDFRQYARASLKRRVQNHLAKNDVENISDLIPQILRHKNRFQGLLFDISVTVTEMFRDPWFFKTLREEIFPFLNTFPFINIWVAGCATGEEVYSLAIILKEENLYQRCRIYATDINDAALEKARSRIYPLKNIQKYHRNYLRAGGKHSLNDYYLAQYDAAIFTSALLERVTFASHNLATDSVFGEIHLILCRNVLIYFNRSLQNQVLNLFCNSMRHNGYLCLGSRETLEFSDVTNHFISVAPNERIYQYKGTTAGLSPKMVDQER